MTHGKRRVGWMTGGLLTAALVGLTGCSNGSDSAEDDSSPKTSTSSPAQSEQTETAGEQQDKEQNSSAAQSSPESTVAAWVAAVVKGDTKQACLLMGEAAKGSSPAMTGSEETCADDSAQGKQIQQGVAQFKESFTPDPPTDDPKVEVAEATATDGKATYPADQITIDGRTLEEVIISNSTGVEKGQLDVKVESSQLDDAWYVTDMHFDIG